jgi:exopolysaccharide production protein ExoZ
MITNIQVLRALAALAVVFYHTGYLLGGGIHTDFEGVAVFFVISGFIIPRVGYRGSSEFLLHRFIRIVPIYWFATLGDLSWFTAPGKLRIALTAVCVGSVLVPEDSMRRLLASSDRMRWLFRILALVLLVTGIDFLIRGLRHMPPSTFTLIIKSLAFIPARDINGDIHPYLGPGWTLNLEMFFYALFALALAVRKRLAPALTASVLLFIPYLYHSGVIGGLYAEFYSHEYIRCFVYGMGLYYAYGFAERVPARILRNPFFSTALGLLCTAIAAVFVASKVWPQSVQLPYGPALLVAAALLAHLVEWRITIPWIVLLGNASYVLYLFHIFFLETLRPFIKIDSMPGLTVVLAISSVASVAIHRYVEVPLMAYLRRRVETFRMLGTSNSSSVRNAGT